MFIRVASAAPATLAMHERGGIGLRGARVQSWHVAEFEVHRGLHSLGVSEERIRPKTGPRASRGLEYKSVPISRMHYIGEQASCQAMWPVCSTTVIAVPPSPGAKLSSSVWWMYRWLRQACYRNIFAARFRLINKIWSTAPVPGAAHQWPRRSRKRGGRDGGKCLLVWPSPGSSRTGYASSLWVVNLPSTCQAAEPTRPNPIID